MKLDIMRMGTKSSGFVYIKKLEKHGTHDQSSHNPHKGGRGALAGGTSRTSAEIKEKYADFELSNQVVFPSLKTEVSAVEDYVAQGAKINSVLRKGDPDEYLTDETKVSDIAVKLDSAIEAAPPMPNTAVWRVANVASVEGLKVGDVVRDKGYASTTIADLTKPENGMMLLTLNSVSSGRKTLLEINTGERGKGLFIPAAKLPAVGIDQTVDFEQEFLFPRNSRMEYLGIRDFPLSGGKTMDIHQFKVVNG